MGENETFSAAEDWLREKGVEVINVGEQRVHPHGEQTRDPFCLSFSDAIATQTASNARILWRPLSKSTPMCGTRTLESRLRLLVTTAVDNVRHDLEQRHRQFRTDSAVLEQQS